MSSTRVLYALLGLVTALGLLTVGYELGKKEGRREAEVAQSGLRVPWYELAEAGGTPRALTEPVDQAAQDEIPSQEDQDWPARSQRTYRPRRGEPSAEDCKHAIENLFERLATEADTAVLIRIISLRLLNGYVTQELGSTFFTGKFEAEVEYLVDNPAVAPPAVPLRFPFLWPGDVEFFDVPDRWHRGDRGTLHGKVCFKKTDRGWLGIDDELY